MTKQQVNTRSTYRTDSLRRIKNEDGTTRVARMAETRAVAVTLTTHEGGVFHRGARVA